MQRKLIVSSFSPEIKQLMRQLDLTYEVMVSDYKEKRNPRLKTKGQVEFTAKERATSIAEKIAGEDCVILGLDTQLEVNGEMLGKPKSAEESRQLLTTLSGKTHVVYTAFTLIDGISHKTLTQTIQVSVSMKPLTKREIDGYSKTKESLSHKGGYSLNGQGAVFIQETHGDYYSALGLPLSSLYEALKSFGIYAI